MRIPPIGGKLKGYKLVSFCEFDKYAEKSYCAIHGVDENLNLGDITRVNESKLEPFTMIVGGSPCQDFSNAGKQKGSKWKCKKCDHEYNPLTVHWTKRSKCPNCGCEELDKTRSSLLVEWLRVIRANKPNFGIYENVKNIVGKQFKETTFKLFEDELQEYGYNTYWKVLNSKNYGVPQNRERVYLILIRKELDNGMFEFPNEVHNGLKLKDLLEDEVDEKYYIDKSRLKIVEKLPVDDEKPMYIGNMSTGKSQCGSVYSEDGVSQTICAGSHGYATGYVGIKQATKKGFIECELGGVADLSYPGSETRRGRVQENGNISPTITATETGVCKIESDIRVRQLIPLECFRLMAFTDDDFKAAQETGMSDTQLYKQAGNSITVCTLYHILVSLYHAMPYLFDDLKLSSYFSGIGAFEKALDLLYESINDGNFHLPPIE